MVGAALLAYGRTHIDPEDLAQRCDLVGRAQPSALRICQHIGNRRRDGDTPDVRRGS